MPRPKYRISVRVFLVMVALIAVMMGLATGPRWRLCSREAAYHASEERMFLEAADRIGGGAATQPVGVAEAGASKFLATIIRKRAEEHARKGQLWERARWNPWAPLPPIEPRRESRGSRRPG